MLFAKIHDKGVCERLANNIITTISSIESVAGCQLTGKLGASIGISVYPDHGGNTGAGNDSCKISHVAPPALQIRTVGAPVESVS